VSHAVAHDGQRQRIAFRLAAALLLAFAACAPYTTFAAEVVEFYNAVLDNFFITADPVEAAAVDAGAAGPGWSRTGFNFSSGGPIAVCRFYGSITPGPNSHFYTALPDECASPKALQATTPASQKRWNFESLDFFTAIPAGGNCAAGTIPVYRAYNNGFSRGIDSNHRISTSQVAIQQVVNRGWTSEGVVMCAPSSGPVTDADIEADIVRLLEQSTMGATEALIAEVKQKGVVPWLDEQLALYESKYTPIPQWGYGLSMQERTACVSVQSCGAVVNSPELVAREFFTQAISGRDQVRQRFAYVLHQLLVKGEEPRETYSIRNAQQMLRDLAFSTYDEALFQYTISPQLGNFQGWANNWPEHDGIKPNENYAREIMQLLTTGVTKLNDDGTEQKLAGKPIPAYAQADVTTMSRILTGYTYGAPPGFPIFASNFAPYSVGSMIPDEAHHDRGAKSLFNGKVQFAAGQGAEAEIRAAVRALVAQDGTPPFIVKQLIQRMVTSSPSPDYMRRVVSVFKDNGAGIRGDLKAVVRAILLDPDARGAVKTDPAYGRMREPALFLTSIARALDIRTDGQFLLDASGNMDMHLFSPSTIFSYFPADFRIDNGTLPAAEFGIYGTSAYVTRVNTVNQLILFRFGPPIGDQTAPPVDYLPNSIGTYFATMSAFVPSASDPTALVERFNRLFFHNAMTMATKQTMINAIAAVPSSDLVLRAKLGAYLSLTSLGYLIQK